MADPLNTDLIADRRVVFEDQFSFLDEDWTGSDFKIQVRLFRDTTTTPLLDFTSPSGVALEYAGTDTVANHVAAGRVDAFGDDNIYETLNEAAGRFYLPGDSLTLSRIDLALDASAFPFPEEIGDDLTTYYDIIRTPPTGQPKLIMRGQFVVRAGVTIP
jgi:hypothetical protein